MTHRLRRGLLAAVLALTIFTGGLLSACGSDGQKSRSYAPAASVPRAGSGGIRESSGPPSGLSRRGRVLWQFEALLHDTFGSGSVCANKTTIEIINDIDEISWPATNRKP